jgi:hypothetical protein
VKVQKPNTKGQANFVNNRKGKGKKKGKEKGSSSL